jgi:hypothetical protein
MLLTTVDQSTAFTPVMSGDWNAAARLSRAILAAATSDAAEPPDDLRAAAREFAIDVRAGRLPPERLVVLLKEVFERLDHHVPSLADPMMLDHDRDSRPRHAEWYAGVLALCIEAYFEAGG